MESKGQEKYWIIKSATRIMGPYTSDEIFELLKKKHISLLDEARNPSTRWTYIREHKLLADVIRRLKDFESPFDQTVSTMTGTQTISKTENIYDIEEKSVDSDTITDWGRSGSLDSIKDISPVREKNYSATASTGASVKSFGLFDEGRVRAEAEDKARNLKWFLLGTLAVIVLGFFAYQIWLRTQKSQNYQNLIATALKYKSLQLYEKSYNAFKKAASIDELEPDIKAQMSQLGVIYDKDAQVHKKNLEAHLLAEQSIERAEKVDNLTVIGVAYAKEGDRKKAEQNFQQALSLDPFNRVVLLNQSLLKIENGQFPDAFINLKKISSSELNPLITYVKSWAFIRISSHITEEVNAIYNEMNQVTKVGSYFQSEINLLKTYLTVHSHLASRSTEALDQFIQSYPRLTRQYVKDFRVDWRNMGWPALQEFCEELAPKFKDLLKENLLMAHCLMNNDQVLESQKYIDQAYALAPEDNSVINTQIHWLNQMKKSTEAWALILAHEDRLFPSALIAAGQIALEKKDFESAEKYFSRVLAMDKFFAPAYHGLAEVYLKKGKVGVALQNIKLGLDREPLYLPLLEMRESLESRE